MVPFCFFTNLLHVWLTRRQLDSYLVHSVCHELLFWLDCMKERWPPTDNVVWKRKSVLIAFSCNCGYSILISHRDSTRDHFLKADCCVVLVPRAYLCEPLPACGSDSCFSFLKKKLVTDPWNYGFHKAE